jgi:hypothetical protein
MLVVDAKHQVSDPHRDKALQGHKGLHPTTMKATADRLHYSQLTYLADHMVSWTESFYGEDKPTSGTDLVIITVCNKMRHRSIAAKELILQSMRLRKQEIRCEMIRVGGPMPHWSNLCGSKCPECSWEGQDRKDLVEQTVEAFGVRFENALKGRSLKRGDYTPMRKEAPATPQVEIPRDESPELFPEEDIEEDVPPRVLKQQEPTFDKEHLEYFADGSHEEFRTFLEGLEIRELHIFLGIVAEIFNPEDAVGPRREDKLLKLVQYVKRYNLTFEIIQRWYSNALKSHDREVAGWKDESITVPEKEESPSERDYKIAKSKIRAAPKMTPPSGTPPPQAVASSSVSRDQDASPLPMKRRMKMDSCQHKSDRRRAPM